MRRHDSPYHYFNDQTRTKLQRSGDVSAMVPGGTSPSLDELTASLTIHGTVDQVVEQVLALRQKAGPFGTLLYNGIDWAEPELARKSMVLMAEQVMPRVKKALSEPAVANEFTTSKGI
jgi:alkanesulfonate monooxygenase SsuD/methylene tetrahydromethanopterin reductase-like flavin-dependent oxidoreductase (luciferase family)